MSNHVTRRGLLRGGVRLTAGVAAGAALAACGATPTPQVVEKVVTQVVEREVTTIVEGTAQVVKETVVVEVTAAAAPTAVQTVTEIRFDTWASTPLLSVYRRVLLPRFSEAHPEIKVSFSATPYSEWSTAFTAQMAANDLPDLYIHGNYMLPSFAARGICIDLNDLLDGDQAIMDVTPAAAWQGCRIDGKTWGAPMRLAGNALVYNEVLFDNAGLAYPDDTWTHEDFLTAAQLLTIDESGKNSTEAGFDSGKTKQYGYYARNYTTTDYGCQIIGWGASMFKDAENLEPNFTDPVVKEALQWVFDLILTHRVAPDTAEQEGFGPTYQTAFTGGHCAMMTHLMGQEGSWAQGEWSQWKDGYGLQATVLPRWPKTRCNLASSNVFFIPPYSKAKEAAWALARFSIMDLPFQAAQTDPGKYMGPANVLAWEEPGVLQGETPPLTNQRAFLEAFYSGWEGVPWDWNKSVIWRENWDTLTKNLGLVWEQAVSLDEALANIQAEMEKNAAEWKASL